MQTAAALALCLLLPIMAQELKLGKWETFADGSVGRTTGFGIVIPAYVCKPAGQGPFPVIMLIYRHTYSKQATYEFGHSTEHPVASRDLAEVPSHRKLRPVCLMFAQNHHWTKTRMHRR